MIRNKVDAKVVMEPKETHSTIVISWLCAKWKAKRILICGVKKIKLNTLGGKSTTMKKKTFTCLYAKYDRAEKRQ